MDSDHRSPVKDQLAETVLFDFPAEARKRTIGGRRSQPRDLGDGDQRLIYPHRIHVGETSKRIRSSLCGRMLDPRVEGTDRIPVHARPPQCVARQVGVAFVTEHLAVDLEIGRGAPSCRHSVFTERAVLGIEVFLPKRRRLHDVAVAVEHYPTPSRD
jgi:hypothetical protein